MFIFHAETNMTNSHKHESFFFYMNFIRGTEYLKKAEISVWPGEKVWTIRQWFEIFILKFV